MGKARTIFKACRVCRHNRVRCDGQQPCQRCARLMKECLYDQRPGETKERLRSERETLQSHVRATSAIIDALVYGENKETILFSLQNKEPIEQIASKLLRGRPGAGIIRSHIQTSSPDDVTGDGYGHQLGLQAELDGSYAYDKVSESFTRRSSSSQLVPSKMDQISASTYTNIDVNWTLPGRIRAADNAWDNGRLTWLPYQLVKELIDIFFSRQYLPFPVINQDLFMQDFHTGKRMYCSSALLMSICCMSCRILGGYNDTRSLHATLGSRLFDEAARLLKLADESEYTIPDVQAYGLMSLHQMGHGEYIEARELADESVRRVDMHFRHQSEEHSGDSPFQTSRATTLLGSISLARMIRLTIMSLSNLAPSHQQGLFSIKLIGDPASKTDPHVEQLLSVPGLIRLSDLPQGIPHIPSIMFQLTDWIYAFSSRSQILSDDKLPQNLRDTYRACLIWYDSTLQSISNRSEAGPFLHLFYHFCLLTLFRPFRHLQCVDLGVSPVDICAESAESILALAESCNQLGKRHLPCFVPLFVHAAGLTGADIIAGCTVTGEVWQLPVRQFSSVNHAVGDEIVRTGRSLAQQAWEKLVVLSEVYPSAHKCMLGLHSALNSQLANLTAKAFTLL